MLAKLRQIALDQIARLNDETRIVIVSTRYRSLHLIISDLLRSYPTGYLALEGSDLNPDDLRSQIDGCIAQMAPGMSWLIIDECDRARPESIVIALQELLADSRIHRVILFSRDLPTEVLTTGSLRAASAILPHYERLMLQDYLRRDSKRQLLEVCAFDGGRVYLDGKPIKNWDGVLPRLLFFYLVDRGMATRGEIFETFWPEMPKREATNVFHVTKRKVNEILGMDLTTYWSGYYRISNDLELRYDAILFTEMIQNSLVASGDQAADYLTHAATLYRGHFLNNHPMPWIQRRHQEMREEFADALVQGAIRATQVGDHEQALRLYLHASTLDAPDETVVAGLMSSYRHLRMPIAALQTYHTFANQFRKEVGMEPDPSLRQLAESIEQEIITG